MENRRHTRFYVHRLVGVVQQTRDLSIATGANVPRSTAAGWLKQGPRAVAVATDDRAYLELHRRLAKLERRCQRLEAILRLFVVLCQA